MTSVTGSGHHELHGGLSFGQEEAISLDRPYGLDTEDEMTASESISFPGSKISDLSTSAPLPNPHFVFPARQDSSSAPSQISRTSGRRPKSAYEMQSGTTGFGRDFQLGSGRSLPPALPAFSFHPSGAASTETGMSSPPMSPQSPTPGRLIPSRPGGHRRRGSEFIGGDGVSGNGGLMSTSPTKGDDNLPPPSTQPPLGPSTGRRGHAHRRSAAMSCHDLNMILKPANSNGAGIGGSAPTSPSDLEPVHIAFPTILSVKQESSSTSSVAASSVASPPDSPKYRASKARVGFSDTLEFIPRPLSIVSSDTSSTATMRQGHSVSGSLSSLMSMGANSPPAKEVRDFTSAIGNRHDEGRPSSAGPILGRTTEIDSLEHSHYQHGNWTLLKGQFVVDTPLTPRSASNKFVFFNQDTPGSRDGSPSTSRPASSASSERVHSVSSPSAPSSPDHQGSDLRVPSVENTPEPTRKPSLTRKPSKKQKKVKSWAGSILSRKARPRSQKQKPISRRSPTPPIRAYPQIAESLDHGALEAPENLIESASETLSDKPSLQTDIANWKPRQVVTQEDDAMSPMIDLDAALGPFNTPSGFDLDWELSKKGSGSKKRPMHSAAGMKGFVGPGMHYHRRAESAPEMTAFDNPRLRLHHIGSNSTMEDVFEEDEEEDGDEVNTASHRGSTAKVDNEKLCKPESDVVTVEDEIQIPDVAMDWTASEISTEQRGLKRKSSGLSDGGRRPTSSSMKSERTVSSLPDETSYDGAKATEILGESTVSRPQSSSEVSLSSFTHASHPQLMKELAPVEIHSHTQQPLYLTPTSQQSSFPSPFPSPRSPMSYDTQKVSTAPSSFTDDPSFHSLWLGEPGPELRMSVDDVPSLTSSNSTMTRESFSIIGTSSYQMRNSQRPTSLPGSTVARKRSSIASLSRLLTSSHGEKSKLSIEDRPPGSPEKKESKGKRLSRMIQFWKHRDPSPSQIN